MKKILLFLLLLIFIPGSVNAGNDKADPVTMVSYEQRWLDAEGTLALKNNTQEDIKNISFRIIYMDMQGNSLDYEDYEKKVLIPPGMVKKVNIPAYERDRHYQYYKTKDHTGSTDQGLFPTFKIRFKLQGYNSKKENNGTTSDVVYQYSNTFQNSSDDGFLFDDIMNMGIGFLILLFLGLLAVVSISIGLYVLVAVMARKRERNVALWIVLSIITHPLLSILILLCIGHSGRREYIYRNDNRYGNEGRYDNGDRYGNGSGNREDFR